LKWPPHALQLWAKEEGQEAYLAYAQAGLHSDMRCSASQLDGPDIGSVRLMP